MKKENKEIFLMKNIAMNYDVNFIDTLDDLSQINPQVLIHRVKDDVVVVRK